MAELQQLQEFEIPTGREALRGNHSALLRVADYCENNYVQATDKRKALEETMAFTTQALASVAYQVGNLAGHTLRMLDLQAAALRQVEARVSTLGQMVNMHMEKVARREIGTLATIQRLPPGQKIIAPENLPHLTPYYRRPLNFSCLDDIGHGIKHENGSPATATSSVWRFEVTVLNSHPELLWGGEGGTSPSKTESTLPPSVARPSYQPTKLTVKAHKAERSASLDLRPGLPRARLRGVGWESRLGSGSRHLLSLFASAPPPFPLWDAGAPLQAPVGVSARPLLPPQDLSTQLSRTGTLSRKSIKAPATPASATLGSAEGVGGVSMAKGQPAPPPPPPVAPDFFLLPPSLEKLSLPPPAPELPMPLDLPPPPPLDVDDLELPPPPPPGFGSEEPSWVPDAYLEKVVTLYPYTRQKDNELSFSEGTVICITRRYSDGWCEGVCSEGSGFFPGNYVEPIS
ncbi:hypothetical protein K5549_001605 [Capra hircus]|nr:hypothetical protein K5549_001605 [Capra hircus]